ncbi:MAG: hypothetical protein M5U19_13590 [Microthrixaceae bacterium]|nr:hypothetical protein [Microthrixaceae bacterium]
MEALSQLPPEMRLIGGLAVVCRVGVPHRATVDLDALTRDLELFDATLQRLALSSSGGGQYVMPGRLDLDVIDVAPGSAEQVLAELLAQGPLSDLERNVVAHTWAHDNATLVEITVVDEGGIPLMERVERLVASTAGLVAMKATTVPPAGLRETREAGERSVRPGEAPGGSPGCRPTDRGPDGTARRGAREPPEVVRGPAGA